MDEDEDAAQGQKRGREEGNVYTLDIKEPETEERAIATNRREEVRAQRKSLAWGAVLFAVGVGAAYVVVCLHILSSHTDLPSTAIFPT